MKEWLMKENTGMWTVLGPYLVTEKGEKKYLCRCDCGTERYVLERGLRYGGSKSCGCQTLTRAREQNTHQLLGMTFGDLTVVERAEKKNRSGGVWWVCRCICGNYVEAPGTLLVNGKKSHCGCKRKPQYHTVDITGRQFDRLTAQYPLDKRDPRGSVIWHCLCRCGNEIEMSYNALVYSDIRSCGCWKRERESKLGDLITHVDGTSIDMIKSKKLPINNTSGTKGVYFQKGKWLAKIVFQKKQYHLGQYALLEDARQARLSAEKLLFEGTAEHYARWQERALWDPQWAKENPIRILVNKKSGNELDVKFLPQL